jgi:hypothetical protein
VGRNFERGHPKKWGGGMNTTENQMQDLHKGYSRQLDRVYTGKVSPEDLLGWVSKQEVRYAKCDEEMVRQLQSIRKQAEDHVRDIKARLAKMAAA